MPVRIASAFFFSAGSARETSSSAVASQPLSTLDRNGLSVLPSVGKVRSFAPVVGLYQL